MRILTFSTLYPNAARPAHGIFVETRLRELLAGGKFESQVVAPVPWFPWSHSLFGQYAQYANAPREEVRHGVRVLHPRYPALPKIGMTVAPFLLAFAVRPVIQQVLARYAFDVIDAHYFYPDGVAAAILGRYFRKPVVITARGSDVNEISQYYLPRRMIQWAAMQAAGVVTVCRALKHSLMAIGVPEQRITVLRNGVDLQLFHPLDRGMVRRELGFSRTTLLSVGHLVPLKGHDIAIGALRLLPECDLVVAGSGPQHAALVSLASDLGVADRVSFAGVLSQVELQRYYSAADALVLASSTEGWANVLLESMACGTPVVATDAGGTSEVVTAPEAGMLFEERTPEALARAVRRLLERSPDPRVTRRYAEQFSWAATAVGQAQLFERILSMPRTSAEARALAR